MGGTPFPLLFHPHGPIQDSPPSRPDLTYAPDVCGSHTCFLGRAHACSGVVSVVIDGFILCGGVFGGGGVGVPVPAVVVGAAVVPVLCAGAVVAAVVSAN